MVDDVIKFVSDKSLSIEAELEKYNKVDDAVTADKKHSNDIQGSEEEDKQQLQSTATTKQSFQKLQNKPFWIWNIQEHKLEDT